MGARGSSDIGCNGSKLQEFLHERNHCPITLSLVQMVADCIDGYVSCVEYSFPSPNNKMTPEAHVSRGQTVTALSSN